MFAIYRKELKLYASGLSAYLSTAAITLVFGIFSAVFNLYMGYTNIAYPLVYSLPFLMLLVPVPLLFAEKREREGNGAAFLLSLPISPVGIVMGKFFAALTLFALPLLIIAATPLLFSFFGDIVLASAYTSVLGLFLFVACLIALIQFLLAVIPSFRIGVCASFGAVVLLYAIDLILSLFALPEIGQTVLEHLNPIDAFYAFTYDVFYIPGIVFFLCATLFLICLHTLVYRYKRGEWLVPSLKRKSALALCISLLLTVFLNVGIELLPRSVTEPNVSGSETFRVSGKTLDYLKTLQTDVTVYYLCKGGSAQADRDIHAFLKEYENGSAHVRVEIIDPLENPDFLSSFGNEQVENGSFIVSSKDRYYVVNSSTMYHYYNAELELSLSPAEYSLCLSTYLAYLETSSAEGLDPTFLNYGYALYYSTATVAYFDGDYQLANAIQFVTSTKIPTVYVLSNDSFNSLNTYLLSLLKGNSYFLRSVSSMEQVSEDCDLLLLYSPKKDIAKSEADLLRSYLSDGGKMFLVTSFLYSDLPNLMEVMSDYGMGVEEEKNYICEADPAYLLSKENDYYFYTHVKDDVVTSAFEGSFVSVLPHSITLKEVAGVKLTPWLYTSDQAYLTLSDDTQLKDEKRSFVCGAIAEKENTKVMWISSEDAVSSAGYSFSGGDNFVLLSHAFGWMSPISFEQLPIESSLINTSSLLFTNGEMAMWSLIFILVIPAIPLCSGLIIRYVRRKK